MYIHMLMLNPPQTFLKVLKKGIKILGLLEIKEFSCQKCSWCLFTNIINMIINLNWLLVNVGHREDLERLLSIPYLRQNSPNLFFPFFPHAHLNALKAEGCGRGERRGKIGLVNFVSSMVYWVTSLDLLFYIETISYPKC